MNKEQSPTATQRRKKTRIDPDAWYCLSDIVEQQMFPWVKQFKAVRNVVVRDKDSKNILKAAITGTGRGTKYKFKGSNLINFISEFEAGKAKL